MADHVVKLRGISKRFPGVKALDGVTSTSAPGEVHAMAGENGAGKSTLMKLLSQARAPDDGRVEIEGEPVRFRGPARAGAGDRDGPPGVRAGAPPDVAENLVARARAEPRRADRRAARRRAGRGSCSSGVKLDVDPARRAGSLSVADQQRVEIAKALAVDAKVVIMDEPTATLTEPRSRSCSS